MKIKLSGISPQSLVNGEGLRKIFFSQGCSHRCDKCFNPETWPFDGGKVFDIDELVDDLKNQTYLDGVTFSGGDPMDQSNAFAELAYKIKTKLNMNIWCYTGYTWEELLIKSHKDISIKNLLKNIDVLIDGPFINKLKSAQSKYRGSTNQRLIDVSQSLKLGRLILYVLK